MKALLAATALLAVSGMVSTAAIAGPTQNDKVTVAVFGDWPYSDFLLDNANLLIDSVNSDPDVSLVIHVGDIHSGHMACTSAGILPPIPASNPGWNQQVYDQFQQFEDPLVYTPGDNEWTDCHKSKELSSGAPLKELAAVRGLFFARPGHTLGLTDKEVLSQAKYYDPDHPADAQYVENVIWETAKVMFVTVNMPGGSNNDDPTAAPWTGNFADPTAQAAEKAERTAADIRWLQAAFGEAEYNNDKALVIALQADLWDPEKVNSTGLDQYAPFVQALADAAVAFGRPVLVLNGDSHVYETDHPLADPTSETGQIYNTQPVSNLTRITVQGSTHAPAEWLKLTIDPRHSDNAFSFENVVYCSHPDTESCN